MNTVLVLVVFGMGNSISMKKNLTSMADLQDRVDKLGTLVGAMEISFANISSYVNKSKVVNFYKFFKQLGQKWFVFN